MREEREESTVGVLALEEVDGVRERLRGCDGSTRRRVGARRICNTTTDEMTI